MGVDLSLVGLLVRSYPRLLSLGLYLVNGDLLSSKMLGDF